MSKIIDVQVPVDLSDPKQFGAYVSLLSAIGGVKSVSVDTEEEEEPAPKKAPTRPSRAKPKAVVDDEDEDEDEEQAPKKTAPKKPAAKPKGVTEQMVRDLLLEVAQQCDEDRDAAKKKLTRYGAESVSELDAEDYEGFYNYLKTLQD